MSLDTLLDDAEFPECRHLVSCCASQDLSNVADIRRKDEYYYCRLCFALFPVSHSASDECSNLVVVASTCNVLHRYSVCNRDSATAAAHNDGVDDDDETTTTTTTLTTSCVMGCVTCVLSVKHVVCDGSCVECKTRRV